MGRAPRVVLDARDVQHGHGCIGAESLRGAVYMLVEHEVTHQHGGERAIPLKSVEESGHGGSVGRAEWPNRSGYRGVEERAQSQFAIDEPHRQARHEDRNQHGGADGDVATLPRA